MSRSRSKKAISYARTAREDPSRIAAQHAANRSAATANGHSIVEEVSDEGYAGTTLVRPGLASILTRAAAGELAGARIYVTEAHRLARGPGSTTTFALIETLRALGVGVVIVSGTEDSGVSHYLAELDQDLRMAEEHRKHVERARQGWARRKARLAKAKSDA